MFSSRIKNIKDGIFSQYNRAASWVTAKSESESALYIRGIASGAVKAALGVNYIVDLGLSAIPQTSAFYNGFKIVKYVATSATFIVTSVSAYKNNKMEISTRAAIKELEEKLAEVDGLVVAANAILHSQQILLDKIKNPFNPIAEVRINISSRFLQEDSLTKQSKCSLLDTIYESKPSLFIRSAVDGAIKASGVYYVIDLASTYIPATKLFSGIKYAASAAAFLKVTYQSYSDPDAELVLSKKLQELKLKLIEAYNVFALMEKRLGNREQLIKMAEEGAKFTDEIVWFESIKQDSQILKAKFDNINESKLILGLRSGMDGAVSASEVHYALGLVLPTLPVLKYVGALGMWAVKARQSFKHREIGIETRIDTVCLQESIATQSVLLDVAKTVIKQQAALIPSEPHVVEELKIDDDEEANEWLIAGFEEISSHSREHILQLSGVSIASVAKGGVFGKSSYLTSSSLTEPLLQEYKENVVLTH